MAEDKTRRFLNQIIERTVNGQLAWEKTPTAGLFQATVASYVVTFSRQVKTSELFVLNLYNSEGELIETLNDEMFDAQGEAPLPNSVYTRMGNAYETARRRAMGVEKALDDILGQLENE